MDSRSPMSVFNTQMINFVIELTEMYPNDTNFKAVYSGLTLLKKTNPRLVSESFKEFVYPFRKEILYKNEKLFLEMDFKEYTNRHQNGLLIMKTLKEYWKDLSNESKNCMWTYFRVLIFLCDKI